MMDWPNRFVGIPYQEYGRTRLGCDCWGLACIIYQEELGVSLPEYLGQGAEGEHAEIAALIAGEAASPLWVPVDGPAVAFDIAVFRRDRWNAHVGIVIRHGLMIHVSSGDCAKVESYDVGRWRPRLNGVYRHVELIGLAAR
ncbi:C40 family peptidase [Salipiger abyssi]|uniref:NlpC/P60 family protein n=1 Tax=Salipiger abyssi TaxID=1250539 RepID=A0A1P8UXJ4_9RHOB|nr:NlpC/P60 family protein [Salipiger abyssi]APZ54111.1 NlpC/P60 family protein [Salipiger abyssi]